jgi:hypothetical protein
MVTPAQPRSKPSRSRIVSDTGLLRNEHFILQADHLMLEVDTRNLQLVSAIAEGGVQVRMLGAPGGVDFIVLARSAVYQAGRRRIMLNGWEGIMENGVMHPPSVTHQEMMLLVDGTFFHGSSPCEPPEVKVRPLGSVSVAA